MNRRSLIPARGASAVRIPERKRGVGRPAAPAIVERILGAAEKLFSTRGYHGTGIREIAEEVGVTPGNVYNHFDTKERLFAALMEDRERRYLAPDQPIPRALEAMTEFPEGLEALGRAAKEQVRRHAGYIRLIYVDVIEFEGKHLRRLYGGMRERFEAIFTRRFEDARREGRIPGDVDPVVSIMMTTISYMHYFTVEHIFGVRGHYGVPDEAAIIEMARTVRYGVQKRRVPGR